VKEDIRPAFYALRAGGWRDYVTLLHPPYTAWHLSYVVVGAALAPEWRPDRLGAGLVAFFLGLGVAAHALDEVNGRPLGTQIPAPVLWALAACSLAGAVAVGIAAAVAWTPWLLAFVAAGGFVACAYNLELLGGRFHGDAWFAVSWGALPLLASYLAAAGTLAWQALLAAAFAALLSLAQRRLSTAVRLARRGVARVAGTLELHDGQTLPLTRERLVAAPEEALRALALAVVCLAAALVVLRER